MPKALCLKALLGPLLGVCCSSSSSSKVTDPSEESMGVMLQPVLSSKASLCEVVAVVRVVLVSPEGLTYMSQRELREYLQAHLYKCINGHLYLVDGCGECVECGACSECGVRIGAGSGDRHARRTAKRVAARLLQEAAFE